MKSSVLSLIICFASYSLFSQSTMVKCYLVNDKGDTLRGEAKINLKKEIDYYNKVTFKDESGMQKIYKPTKIKSYCVNEEHFVAMDWEDEKKFYKVLTLGDINFYKLGYETMKMNEIVFEAEYYMSRTSDTTLHLIKESKFKKTLTEWTKDNPEIAAAYGEEKKFDLDKAVDAVKNYNSWKASQ